MSVVIHNVKPFSGHFVYAVDVDGFQQLRFNKWNTVGPAVRLTRSGVNNPSPTVFKPACFEYCERSNRVHLQVFERLLHRLDVTDVAGQVKDIRLAANKLAHEFHVAAVAFNNFYVFVDRFDVEKISAASGMQRIEDRNGGTKLN